MALLFILPDSPLMLQSGLSWLISLPPVWVYSVSELIVWT